MRMYGSPQRARIIMHGSAGGTGHWPLALGLSIAAHVAGLGALGVIPVGLAAPPQVALPSGSGREIQVMLAPAVVAAAAPSEDRDDDQSPAMDESSAQPQPAASDQQQRQADATVSLTLAAAALDQLADWVAAQQDAAADALASARQQAIVTLAQAASDASQAARQEMAAARQNLTNLMAMLARSHGDERASANPSVPASAAASGSTSTAPDSSSSPAAAAASESAEATMAHRGVDRGPAPASANAPPVYPEEARRRRQAGVVIVHVAIGADGAVQSATLKRTSGFALLDEAAVKAVRVWRFTPATVAGGAAIACEADVPVEFVLRR
jgi:TonB family protein